MFYVLEANFIQIFFLFWYFPFDTGICKKNKKLFLK